MTLGKRIKALRNEKGILQRELAAIMEISEAYLSKIENDQKPIKRSDLVLISKFFKCDVIELETLWLARKICYLLKDEKHALSAIHVAEKEVQYKIKMNE